jgi:hypothetical protein
MTLEDIGIFGISERLSEYIIRVIGEFSTEDNQDAHVMAIEIAHITFRMLCDSYHGNIAIKDIIDRSDNLLNEMIGSHIEA